MESLAHPLRSGVPVLMIDIKGDLPNLLLGFPSFSYRPLLPWARACARPGDTRSDEELAAALGAERQSALLRWGITEQVLEKYVASSRLRVLTPGSGGGESLHVLSGLERRSSRWDTDPEAARAALSAAISLVLRLVGRNPDPAKSRDHVLVSVLAERRLLAGEPATLETLLGDLLHPPCERVGALALDDFLPKRQRKALAAVLNNLPVSPTFQSWRQWATLDVGQWLSPGHGRTPGVVVSVAHLDDEERELVLGVLLEEVLSWVRTPCCQTTRNGRQTDRPLPPASLSVSRAGRSNPGPSSVAELTRQCFPHGC